MNVHVGASALNVTTGSGVLMTVSFEEWTTTGDWDLPIVGFEVSHITIGATDVDIAAYGNGGGRSEDGRTIVAPHTQIRLEGQFELAFADDDRIRLDPSTQAWEQLTAVLSLRRDRISSALVNANSARLEVQFISGRRILAGPDALYENWEISGPGFRFIAGPGGGAVACWGMD